MCRTMGLSAGCICAVVANRTHSEAVVRDIIRIAEEQATAVGLAALAQILG
jgi:uridine phosphorylase